MLWFLAEEMRVGVWKDIGAMVKMNDSSLAACIARQPCMTNWIDIARAYALADFEARKPWYVAAGRAAAAKHGCNFIGSERWSCLRRSGRRLTALDFSLRHKSGL